MNPPSVDGEKRRNDMTVAILLAAGNSVRMGQDKLSAVLGDRPVLAHTLGVSLEDMVYPVKMLQPVEHRLQLLPNGFIDDAYNANPAGFRSALDTLSLFPMRRVLVTPGMVELGERQDALNEELGGYAADKCDVAVLVGEKQAPPLKKGLSGAGFDAEKLYVAKDLADALRYVAALPPAEQIVLLENDLPDNY